MTELLDQAVEKVQALPPEMQDQAARILLIYAGDDEAVVESTPEEEADLIEARAEMERGEFATEAGVQAVLSNYRLRGFGTPSALQQMDETLGYIAVRSPQGAAKVQRRITTILALLQVQPYLGRRTRMPGVRRVFLTPCRNLIDCFVEPDDITVQRFRHAARRPVP